MSKLFIKDKVFYSDILSRRRIRAKSWTHQESFMSHVVKQVKVALGLDDTLKKVVTFFIIVTFCLISVLQKEHIIFIKIVLHSEYRDICTIA